MHNQTNPVFFEEKHRASNPDTFVVGPTELYIVMGLLAYLGLVGTFGNALVLYVFSKKKDKMVSTLFIIIMAIVDFITCIVIIPFTMYIEWVNFVVHYEFVCRLYKFFITSNIPFSAMIMAAIAIDRYLCICHPFLHILTLPRAKIVSVCLGLFAASLGVVPALAFSVYEYKYPMKSLKMNTNSSSSADTDTITYSQSNSTLIQTDIVLGEKQNIYTGVCKESDWLISFNMLGHYQKFYTALFLVCLIIVVVLYTLIYKSVLTRRAKRAKQKSKALPIVVRNTEGGHTSSAQETLLTTVDRNVEETCISTNGATTINSNQINNAKPKNKESKKSKDERKRDKDRKKAKKSDKNRLANLKTAAMLFVVTIVFIVTYLPAFLMALEFIPYNIIVFYIYFANNVANPVIYSFMNRNFRDDLKKIFCRA